MRSNRMSAMCHVTFVRSNEGISWASEKIIRQRRAAWAKTKAVDRPGQGDTGGFRVVAGCRVGL